MNDPGLHEPAEQAAEDVENSNDRAEEEAFAEQESFLDPSRWWFASTGCPLLAGTFGPIANAFSICALVEKWRIYIPPGTTEDDGSKVEDPAWSVCL